MKTIINLNKTTLFDFDNSDYYHGKDKITRFVWIVISAIFLESLVPYPVCFKSWLLRVFGAKVGNGLILKPNVKIKQPWRLEIGDNCWIGEGVWIDNLVRVKLESNVCLSQGAFLLTGNHNYKMATFDLITGEIHLHQGVWIGAKGLVGPGVTCYSHSILSAGSVTFRNLEAYGIYQGNVAVFKRKRVIV